MTPRAHISRLHAATIIMFGVAAVIYAVTAQERPLRATVGQPLTMPVSRAPLTTASPGGARHVVVTVTAFQPSPDGPVQAVVSALCGASVVELGRFGLLPQKGFSAAEPAKAQRFSLPVGADGACMAPDHVTISLAPNQGEGRGASLEIGSAELR